MTTATAGAAGPDDYLIFSPDDVDLARSPLRRGIDEPTFVLGAFNPGLAQLPSGNLLLMVRIAEALSEPVRDGAARAIRWTESGFKLDRYPIDGIDMTDPRQFELKGAGPRRLALTSLSWLLPVELDPDGRGIVAVHYDKAIAPASSGQHYGIEDPRISLIDGSYYMTTCTVSAERLGTTLYTSINGLDWQCRGLILDHLNKDMLFFEGRIDGGFMALTRPLGEVWFAYPPDSEWRGGPSINLARSPDGLHWKPLDQPFLRARNASASAKLGGGSPPILTPQGWLMIYHGVEAREQVGVYRSFWALLDAAEPWRILRLEDEAPLLEARTDLVAPIANKLYLPHPVVFTTGIVDAGDHYIVASGEADLACRITHLPKSRFA